MKIVENRKIFFLVSLIVILAGIIAMIINYSTQKSALNFDIEFTGGVSMEIDIGQEFNNYDIAQIINDVTGQKAPQIQKVIGTNNVSIKMQSINAEQRNKIIDAIKEKYGIGDENIINILDVSGTISGEMQRTAILAVVVSCIAMLIYISIRFRDVRIGASSIIALLHDVFVVIAFYAIMRIPINNSFIAAILTVLGYSINATIVIFDRIRENAINFKKKEVATRINKSITQTIGRSINTSITTLFTIGAIYILGVQSIKEFALPLVIGIISGAYSSIFISGSIWYILLPNSEKN